MVADALANNAINHEYGVLIYSGRSPFAMLAKLILMTFLILLELEGLLVASLA